MKIKRHDPVRRRRSPFSLLLILAAIVVLGLLVASWLHGGAQPRKQVEIAIPADQFEH